ncbi:hypothetical protein TRFO_03133 [Tritrichomonas foetus]|uniref:Uncharacterized protein n=1 Tax=Tritrichomonas foetus TaxID=1144522 RepID=A0A1J4KS48_9EUKA|nr:hypothetical protein TRFO_03133 [Tritrichomonas foetus]|eukprot:OHT14113.1 hypothetical protein TRFO_03133 [Tritrichomonas foetus]
MDHPTDKSKTHDEEILNFPHRFHIVINSLSLPKQKGDHIVAINIDDGRGGQELKTKSCPERKDHPLAGDDLHYTEFLESFDVLIKDPLFTTLTFTVLQVPSKKTRRRSSSADKEASAATNTTSIMNAKYDATKFLGGREYDVDMIDGYSSENMVVHKEILEIPLEEEDSKYRLEVEVSASQVSPSLLVLRVIRGANITRHGFLSSIISREVNPYVEVSYKDHTFMTKEVKNKKNPVWNKDIFLFVDDLEEALISFRLFHTNGEETEPLSKPHRYPLSKVHLDQIPRDNNFPLDDVEPICLEFHNEEGKSACRIYFQAKFFSCKPVCISGVIKSVTKTEDKAYRKVVAFIENATKVKSSHYETRESQENTWNARYNLISLLPTIDLLNFYLKEKNNLIHKWTIKLNSNKNTDVTSVLDSLCVAESLDALIEGSKGKPYLTYDDEEMLIKFTANKNYFTPYILIISVHYNHNNLLLPTNRITHLEVYISHMGEHAKKVQVSEESQLMNAAQVMEFLLFVPYPCFQCLVIEPRLETLYTPKDLELEKSFKKFIKLDGIRLGERKRPIEVVLNKKFGCKVNVDLKVEKLGYKINTINPEDYFSKYLHKKFTKEEIIGYAQLFNLCDTDHGGSLTLQEFIQSFKDYNFGLSRKYLEKKFKQADENDNEEIFFDDFMSFFVDEKKKKKKTKDKKKKKIDICEGFRNLGIIHNIRYFVQLSADIEKKRNEKEQHEKKRKRISSSLSEEPSEKKKKRKTLSTSPEEFEKEEKKGRKEEKRKKKKEFEKSEVDEKNEEAEMKEDFKVDEKTSQEKDVKKEERRRKKEEKKKKREEKKKSEKGSSDSDEEVPKSESDEKAKGELEYKHQTSSDDEDDDQKGKSESSSDGEESNSHQEDSEENRRERAVQYQAQLLFSKKERPEVLKSFPHQTVNTYVRFINNLFNEENIEGINLPIDEDNNSLFVECASGVLYIELVNKIAPGMVDDRAVCRSKEIKRNQILSNINLSLHSLNSCGISLDSEIDEMKLVDNDYNEIMNYIKNLIKSYINMQIRPEIFPELLLFKREDETEYQFKGLQATDYLSRWLWVHNLYGEGDSDVRITNFTNTLRDSKVLAHVMVSIAPEYANLSILSRKDLNKRAKKLLLQLTDVCGASYITPDQLSNVYPREEKENEDFDNIDWSEYSLTGTNSEEEKADKKNEDEIINTNVYERNELENISNPRDDEYVLLIQVAQLFLRRPVFKKQTGITEEREASGESGTIISRHRSQQKIHQKHKLLREPFYISSEKDREVRQYIMWMNSLGVKPVVTHLFEGLKSNCLLVKVVNILFNTTLEVVEQPKNLYRRLEYNANAIKAIKDIDEIKGVDISAQNIEQYDHVANKDDFNRKAILGTCYILMRYYLGKKFGSVSENELIRWANSLNEQSEISSEPISGFRDAKVTSSLAILALIEEIMPNTVDQKNISEDDYMSNAKYVISIVRSIGGSVFALPEDIVEGNSKMIATIYVTLKLIYETNN